MSYLGKASDFESEKASSNLASPTIIMVLKLNGEQYVVCVKKASSILVGTAKLSPASSGISSFTI